MKLIIIKCPECNATVKVGTDVKEVQCEYCGAVAQVQRRTGVLRRPQPLPPPPKGQQPLPVAIEEGKTPWTGGIVVALLLVGIATFCVVGVIECAQERSEEADREAKARAPRWDGHFGGIMVRDVNDDRVWDIIGHMRQQADKAYGMMTAVDGRNGRTLWHCPLGAYRSGQNREPIGVLGNTIVRRSGGAEVVGIDIVKGKVKWRRTLDEMVRRICGGFDTQSVNVQTADKKLYPVAVADGKVSPAKQATCEPIEGPAPKTNRPDRLLCTSHDDTCEQPALENSIGGMHSDLTLYRPSSKLTIALGHKRPGTHVPMIARYRWPPLDQATVEKEMERKPAHWTDAQRRRAVAKSIRREWVDEGMKPEVLWKATVPASDPLSAWAEQPDGESVDLTDQTMLVAYKAGGKKHWRLTAFAVADGRRLWDIDLGCDDPLGAVVATPTHALVSFWTSLWSYDIKTGKPAFTVGACH